MLVYLFKLWVCSARLAEFDRENGCVVIGVIPLVALPSTGVAGADCREVIEVRALLNGDGCGPFNGLIGTLLKPLHKLSGGAVLRHVRFCVYACQTCCATKLHASHVRNGQVKSEQEVLKPYLLPG